MRSTRTVVGALSVALALALTAAAPAGAQSDPRGEAEWLLAAQVPAGALASHVDQTFVNPYLAAFGAIGLADASRLTGDPRYAEAAWRQVEWHASSMDVHGYVTDFAIQGGVPVSTGDADSTDAYAGMFLLAVEAAYRAAPSSTRLLALAPKVRAAVDAVRSTQRSDGLTGAKPAWMVAYLMNEAEAFAGLSAASRLAVAVGDRRLARDAADSAARIARATERLWNPKTGAYDWAVHPSGAHQATNWAQLYPDAISQVWAVRFGLVRGARAGAVLQQFLRSHPNAHDPNAIDLVDGSMRPTGYWPGLGIGLRALDPGAPARYLAGTRLAAVASGKAWPYSVQVAGDTLELITLGA